MSINHKGKKQSLMIMFITSCVLHILGTWSLWKEGDSWPCRNDTNWDVMKVSCQSLKTIFISYSQGTKSHVSMESGHRCVDDMIFLVFINQLTNKLLSLFHVVSIYHSEFCDIKGGMQSWSCYCESKRNSFLRQRC